MEAYLDPLDRLREGLRWFLAVPELLLMHVHASAELRLPALQHISQAQAQPANKAAIFVFTTPAEGADTEWSDRCEELAENFTLLAEEAAKAEPPALLRAPRAGNTSGLHGFAEALKQAASAVAPACQGLVAVLSPEGVTDPARWVAELRQLVSDRTLSQVRFIVLETDPAPSRVLASELAGLGESVDVRLDPSATRGFLGKILTGMKSAPDGADPQRIAGMAGPKQAPPPRAGRGAPLPAAAAAELSQLGMNPALAQPDVMKALRIEALSASLAQQEGRPQDAIQHQVRARDVADAAGLVREATLMQLMLGGYLLQGGGPAQALSVFEDTAKRANTAQLADLEAQSLMAKGGALLMAERPYDAAQAYRSAAAVAETQPSKILAIECYRMMGQILLSSGNETEAASAWQRALAVAEGAPSVERVASSGPIAARDLAALYRRHGMHDQASALEAQVARWETEVPSPAPEAPPSPSEGAVS